MKVKRVQRTKEEQNSAVEKALERIRNKQATLLARVPKSKPKNPDERYEIRLGLNNVVFCSCPDFRYRQLGNCKHIDMFRKQVVVLEVVR